MAVYIDRLRDWGWNLGPSCHLIADSNEELHEFALRLGLRREWFQKAHSGPHYDLTARKRRLAVRLGAVELGDRDFLDILKQWRAEAVRRIEDAESEEDKAKIREWLYH